MTSNGTRLRLIVTVVGSYLAGILPWAMFGSGGLWWVRLLLTASAPLIFMAAIVAAIFPKQIIARPLAWSLCGAGAAVLLSFVALRLATGTSVGFVSIVFAVPAALIFCWLMQVWKSGPNKPVVHQVAP